MAFNLVLDFFCGLIPFVRKTMSTFFMSEGAFTPLPGSHFKVWIGHFHVFQHPLLLLHPTSSSHHLEGGRAGANVVKAVFPVGRLGQHGCLWPKAGMTGPWPVVSSPLASLLQVSSRGGSGPPALLWPASVAGWATQVAYTL